MPKKKGEVERKIRSRWTVLIALTGGIGSGKSTVLKMFKRKGAYTVDCDTIVRQLFLRSSTKTALKKAFGPAIFKQGQVDRVELGRRVFSSRKERRRLERILHPLVRENVWRQLSHQRGPIAVVDVPLLFETGWHKEFKDVVVVTASLKTRLKRLSKKGVSVTEAKRRISHQWPLAWKAKRASYVIKNDRTKKQTLAQVNQLWTLYTKNLHQGEQP